MGTRFTGRPHRDSASFRTESGDSESAAESSLDLGPLEALAGSLCGDRKFFLDARSSSDVGSL